MKILIFEYITGGGFNKQELPDALTREGCLMLQALLDNFTSLTDIDLLVMLDHRLVDTVETQHYETAVINASQHSYDEFVRLIPHCDAVWPIAPEFDGILQGLCEAVEASGKRLLSSPSTVVKATANKYHTYQHLQKYAIATVPTCLLAAEETLTHDIPAITASHYPTDTSEWIIKSIDGVGCIDSWIISDLQDIAAITNKENYIIQPHLHGKKTSLSCLFKNGLVWIISINEQQFRIMDKRYHLSAIIVNKNPDIDRYQYLVDDIAYAFPDLWGYVGIDLIETPVQTWVLEINPRLTTAFVGIEVALGINIADTVLQLLTGSPTLKPQHNKPVTVTIPQEIRAS
ncbi:ATP-grasp domain-containing protein [Crenothrix sp.]|uniref:ATP-grasp domain-containing protein n=1 Tax=Crenothrix sp. TaxID=3100433 RepID=UPI00374D8662